MEETECNWTSNANTQTLDAGAAATTYNEHTKPSDTEETYKTVVKALPLEKPRPTRKKNV